MEVIFSNRAFTAVLAETAEKIKTETGGLFLGTIENDTWYRNNRSRTKFDF